MAVADTLRVELVWKMGAIDFAVNVLHYTTGASDPLTQAMVDGAAADFDGVFTTSGFSARYSDDMSLDRIVVRDLRTDGNGPLTGLIEDVGLQATNPLPAQTCLVTTLRTTNGSRRGRGRIFWPCPHADLTTTTGQANPNLVVDAGDFVDGIMSITAGTLGAILLGVYSRADDLTRTVTAHTTDSVFDVQTRRRDLSIV